jgi:RNA polymerase sigma-70 factor (ECF subfamily)
VPDARAQFEDVYQQYALPVYRFCLTQLRDAALAEDLAADVFVSAYRAFDRAPAEEAGMRPWLFRIATNAVIDHRRRNRRWRQIMDGMLAAPREPAPDVEALAQLQAEAREALAVVASLSARDRTLIGLRVGADLTYPEIAVVMKMNVHAVEVATRRALERARAQAEAQ